MSHLKLVHIQDENARALGLQLAASDKPISNGAFTKLSGVPIHEIEDHHEDSIVIQVTEIAMPLMTAIRNSQRIATAALEDEKPEAHIQALKAMADIMKSSATEYMFNLGIASKAEKEEI